MPRVSALVGLRSSVCSVASLAFLAMARPSAGETPSIGRLVFVGDSITCGVGVRDRASDRYSACATRLLKAEHPGVKEINLGKSGQALSQQRDDYAQEILRANPGAVVVQWGVNDQFWGFSVPQFATRYDALVRALRLAKPDLPIVLTTLVADFRWPENFDAWIGQANVAIQEIAAKCECRVAYVHHAVGHDKAHYRDAIHPNEAGAKLMAEAIAQAFSRPPQTKRRFSVRFDHGQEVRIFRYVFVPQWDETAPRSVHVGNITAAGMDVDTRVPLAVRTPSIYKRRTAFLVTVRDRYDKIIQTHELNTGWSGMLQFSLDPAGQPGPLRVSISEKTGK